MNEKYFVIMAQNTFKIYFSNKEHQNFEFDYLLFLKDSEFL